MRKEPLLNHSRECDDLEAMDLELRQHPLQTDLQNAEGDDETNIVRAEVEGAVDNMFKAMENAA